MNPSSIEVKSGIYAEPPLAFTFDVDVFIFLLLTPKSIFGYFGGSIGGIVGVNGGVIEGLEGDNLGDINGLNFKVGIDKEGVNMVKGFVEVVPLETGSVGLVNVEVA